MLCMHSNRVTLDRMVAWVSGKEDAKDVKLVALVTVQIRVEVVQRCFMSMSIQSQVGMWKDRKNYMAICVRGSGVHLGNSQARQCL